MGNLNKVTYTDHQTVITAANLNEIQNSVIANTSYSTCTTAANTAAKTAALTNFVLTTGSCIRVKFTNSNTASNPTLNVNSTGAKAIKVYGSTAAGTSSATSWEAGAVVEFVYDGTNWIIVDNKSGAFVPKNGGTFTGYVAIDRADGTASEQGWSALILGNNTPTGTSGNSTGFLRIHGTTNKKGEIYYDSGKPTADRTYYLPDANGTLALTSDITFGYKGELDGSSVDLNTYYGTGKMGVYLVLTGVTNAPADYGTLLVMGISGFCVQMFVKGSIIYSRQRAGNPPSWGAWKSVTLT